MELKPEDIDRTHRTAKSNRDKGKPRAIIAKFTSYNTRKSVIKERCRLKGTGIGIQELLTKQKQTLLDRAKKSVNEVPRFKASWTWDGNVVLLVDYDAKGTEKTFTVNSKWDIESLAVKYGQYPHDRKVTEAK